MTLVLLKPYNIICSIYSYSLILCVFKSARYRFTLFTIYTVRVHTLCCKHSLVYNACKCVVGIHNYVIGYTHGIRLFPFNFSKRIRAHIHNVYCKRSWSSLSINTNTLFIINYKEHRSPLI